MAHSIRQRSSKLLPMIKLVHNDFGGAVEAIRLAFHLQGFQFEDVGLAPGKADPLDPSLSDQEVTSLVLRSGEKFDNSGAILRYAGRLRSCGGRSNQTLYPVEDPIKALRCDSIVDATQELYETLKKTRKFPYDASLVQHRATFTTTVVPKWLEGMSGQLDRTGPFAIGKNLYICDLALYCQLKWLRSGIDGTPSGLVDEYPRLVRFMAGVQGDKDVQDYYELHPEEKFGQWLDLAGSDQAANVD